MKTFERNLTGRSTYTCTCCGRNTRDTGTGEAGADCCAFCYEAAGIENSISDGHMTSEHGRELFNQLVKQYGKRAHTTCLTFEKETTEMETTPKHTLSAALRLIAVPTELKTPEGVDVKTFHARVSSVIGHTTDLKGKLTVSSKSGAVVVSPK